MVRHQVSGSQILGRRERGPGGRTLPPARFFADRRRPAPLHV